MDIIEKLAIERKEEQRIRSRIKGYCRKILDMLGEEQTEEKNSEQGGTDE